MVLSVVKKIDSKPLGDLMEDLNEPENVTGRIIFMSMFNDVAWDAKEMMNCV